MKLLKSVLFFISLVLVVNCKGEKKEEKETIEDTETVAPVVETPEPNTLLLTLNPKNDSNISGKVLFTTSGDIVTMKAKLSGLSEGEHAIHIHEKADCSSADGKSTGGHWNPTLTPHGKWGAAEGYHKGDIGNFIAKADGTAVKEFSTNEWCLGCDDPKKNIVGKAIIVHQGIDDFKSQPSGAAGSRVSCGAIIK